MRNKDMKWYWFSFSSKKGHLGCCNIQAKSLEYAKIRLIELNLIPDKHEDVEIFKLTEPELEPNVLVKMKDLKKMGYKKVTVSKCDKHLTKL